MLMEHETTKLKEQEELYARELKEWKAHLKPRKQVFYIYVIHVYFNIYTSNKFVVFIIFYFL